MVSQQANQLSSDSSLASINIKHKQNWVQEQVNRLSVSIVGKLNSRHLQTCFGGVKTKTYLTDTEQTFNLANQLADGKNWSCQIFMLLLILTQIQHYAAILFI